MKNLMTSPVIEETLRVVSRMEKHGENLVASGMPEKLAIPTMEGYELVDFNDIVRCEADVNYTVFHFCSRAKMVVSKSLKDVEDVLSYNNFIRLHRHHLVNLKYAVRYLKGDTGQLVLTDGSMIAVSMRKKNALMERLKKLY